jgi:putative ABC transport system permease protein
LTGLIVSTDYFRVTGVAPAIGRGFAADDATGDGRTVVISHALWQRAFGGDRAIVGRTVMLSGTEYQVIGIMPAGFRAPFQAADIFRPYTTDTFGAGCRGSRGCYVLQVLARMRADVPVEQGMSDIAAVGAAVRERAADQKQGMVFRTVPLKEQLTGTVEPALIALLAAVGLLLLIACVNVANLLLARAAGREREIAVRTAIGASRSTLLRQLLTESVMVGLLGGAAGVLIAFWGVDLLVLMSPPGTPRIEDVAVNGRALGVALLLAISTGLLFGLVPALHLARLDIGATLKEAGALREGVRRRRARSALVVAETAIALTLLAGAGLMMRSFLQLQAVDPGFEPRDAATLQVLLPAARYPEAVHLDQFRDAIEQRIAAKPGVVAVGGATLLPLSGTTSDTDFMIEGQPAPTAGNAPVVHFRSVTPGYFTAMGMTLLRGRTLTDQDRSDAPGVVVINQTMADRYWPGENAIGKRITTSSPEGPWTTVVGVVRDMRHFGLDAPVRPEMYLPYAQVSARQYNIVVRTRDRAAEILPVVRTELRALDPDLPVTGMQTLETIVGQSVAMPRLFVSFFGFFAAVALLLAGIGIYGVTAHAVSQRTQEIGVRIALGADRREVMVMIVGQSMKVAAAGLAIGIVAALLLARLLGSLLFELSPYDPVTFVTIALLLATVAFAASFTPARRAATVDPVKALRRD